MMRLLKTTFGSVRLCPFDIMWITIYLVLGVKKWYHIKN